MNKLLILSGLLATAAGAQVFTHLDAPPAQTGIAGPRPAVGALFSTEQVALRQAMVQAPVQRFDLPLAAYGVAISLPDPSGELVPCFVAESPVMEAGLQTRFPAIRTYIVESRDGSASGRLEVSPRGLTGMLRTARGTWMLDLWQSADPSTQVVYWLDALPTGGEWECSAVPMPHDISDAGYQERTTQTLRTFRLAMACTGEYGAYHSQIQGHAPNIADPLAAMVTVVSRANVVYESDLAVHFNLVANNDQVIFVDPTTDPYDGSCSGSGGADCSGGILGTNSTVIPPRIGDANYDIGHCVTRIFGGVAYLSSVCGGSKWGGVSGIPRGGDVDPLTALVVIHEMGHQFGANHTFSGIRGRCAGNINSSTAWEAGSGSTPMAYPGGCPVGDAPPTDNVVQFADPYFHNGSWSEMQVFLTSANAACPVSTATVNHLPVIQSVTPNQSIPPGTPFTLAATATDEDGEQLTYSWEQLDVGVARGLISSGSNDNGIGALFRAFPPVRDGFRVFPRMADVLSGSMTPGEQLPRTTGATRQFRVIVRDNHPGAGGVAVSSTVRLNIPLGTSPFAVVSPGADGAILNPGPAPIVWLTGGTNTTIGCTNVDIRLSLDDGATFPINLGTFPNTGACAVTIPDSATSTARVKISGSGRIFFAVSRPFAIIAPCLADANADGGVDGADIETFMTFWVNGNYRSDVNFDGGVDGADLEEFFRHWEAGC